MINTLFYSIYEGIHAKLQIDGYKWPQIVAADDVSFWSRARDMKETKKRRKRRERDAKKTRKREGKGEKLGVDRD